MRIVFMGTPDFAAPSLEAIIDAGHEVMAVVTATDKPGGRGRKELVACPVATFARQRGLMVLQPTKLRDPKFQDTLRALHADLFVVVAFRMLPESVWSIPPMGSINLHGSLLPAYRGAAPIHWAILNGEKETGVTVFFLQQEIDTGDILLQEHLPIGKEETTGSLHDRMMKMGARALLRALNAIEQGQFVRAPQPTLAPSHAPKLFPESAALDAQWPVEKLDRWVRGMNPYPTAWLMVDGKKLKVFAAKPAPGKDGDIPGQLIVEKPGLYLAASNGRLALFEVQPEGRNRMAASAYINGLNVSNGILGFCTKPEPS